MSLLVPPIKSQGIKTKLVPWIQSILPQNLPGAWIEPFLGTGAVAFNVAPQHAILCDTNPHLIRFYSALASGEITPSEIGNFLTQEGKLLLERGESHYYEIRARFNRTHSPLDFLFLNRAGFNGMIRFNRKGEFNIPFCRKPERFAQAYVTKIVNQATRLEKLLRTRDYVFKCQNFTDTLREVGQNDIIYCDPPYIDRHTDYFNSWDEQNEQTLFEALSATPAKFILSTWHHNDFRQNQYIDSLWKRFHVLTRDHFYHVGGREDNRNPMVEALITNFVPVIQPIEQNHPDQLLLIAS